MRSKFIVCAACLVAGFLVGRMRPDEHGARRPPGPESPLPETVEVYRHPAGERPAVAETLRVLSADGREVAEPRGDGRSVWTIRVNRGGHVTRLDCEGLTVSP